MHQTNTEMLNNFNKVSDNRWEYDKWAIVKEGGSFILLDPTGMTVGIPRNTFEGCFKGVTIDR